MTTRKLELHLFGGFHCRWSDGEVVDIRGAKHRALIAILATAANGTHTRAWVQETLWMLSGEELGRSSLRRALSDIRKIFGSSFDDVFRTNKADVQIDLNRVELVGNTTDGVFLDGINLPEPGFRTWLDQKRNHFRGDFGSLLLANRTGIIPKLAVLPFLSRHQTESEGHLADLLAMEISRSLSRSRLIDVISHLSSRSLNPRCLDLVEIRKKLGFDYVVYGSTHLNGDMFRVDVDLADSSSGQIIWSEAFTGKYADLLNGQTSIIAEVAGRIGYGVLSASVELARQRPVADIDSHALLMSAVTLMHGRTQGEVKKAKVYLEELLRRRPGQATVTAWLAKWHVMAVHNGLIVDDSQFELAGDISARALDMDPKCAFALAVDGMVRSHNTLSDATTVDRFEDSLQLDPSNALAWLLYSRMHMFNGNGEMALKFADRACSLSPCDPHQYFFDLLHACAKSVCGDYAGALELAQASLKLNPHHVSTHRVKTIALSLMERGDEARASADVLLQLEPGLTIKSFLSNHAAGGDRDMPQLWAGALRRAGVPEA